MATKKFLLPVAALSILFSIALIWAAPLLVNVFPAAGVSNITTLNWQASINVTETAFPNLNITNISRVWYYQSTTGFSNSVNTTMTNTSSTIGALSVKYNASIQLDFTSNHTSPGLHSITFCANNSIGNLTCSSTQYVVAVANKTQLKNMVEQFGGITWDVTYENGTALPNELFSPTEFNYTMRINETATSFTEIVGFAINETMMQNMDDTTQNRTITAAAQASVRSTGFNATDFIWYDISSFLPAASFYKYGRIQLPSQYQGIFYCNGTNQDSASCSSISPCSAVVNITNHASVISTDGACYNSTETSGRTVLYVDHFSGGAGGNDTLAPTVAVNSPSASSAHKANFTANITLADGTGINVSRVFYRIENGTFNSSWIAMTNTSATLFNATFDIQAFADGNYSFRFNASDTLGNVNTTVTANNVTVDDTAPSITAFTLSDTSVDRNDAITGTCTATDNSQDFGGSVSTAVTGIDTSTTGTKTATCTATDSAGNTATDTESYQVSAATSSTTAGGSTAIPSKTTITNLNAGVNVIKNVDTDTGLTELSIEVANAITGAKITVKKLSGLPATISIAAPGAVYNYIDIVTVNIPVSDIKSAKVKFKVEKSWLSANGADKGTIALNRFANGAWNKLSTQMTSEDATYVYYEAETPGFSTFAITGAPAAAPAEAAAPTEGAAQPTAAILPLPAAVQKQTGLLVFVIAIAVILYLVYSMKKPKKGKLAGKYVNLKVK